jgi:hypothetical protein
MVIPATGSCDVQAGTMRKEGLRRADGLWLNGAQGGRNGEH